MNVHNIGQGEARHTRYEKDLNCAAVKITAVQVTNLPLPLTLSRIRFDVLNRSGLAEALHTHTHTHIYIHIYIYIHTPLCDSTQFYLLFFILLLLLLLLHFMTYTVTPIPASKVTHSLSY